MKKHIICLCIYGLISQAYALKRVPIQDQEMCEIYISSKESTRLGVEGDRIKQIFGAGSHIFIETDEVGGQIFLKAQGKIPGKLTIVTEKGITQDLKILLNEGSTDSVLLVPTLVKAGSPQKKAYEMQDLIKIMILDKIPMDIEVFESQAAYVPRVINISVSPKMVYYTQKLKGHTCRVRNDSDEDIDLLESDFVQEGDLGVYLENTHLEKDEETTLYIVSKHGDSV